MKKLFLIPLLMLAACEQPSYDAQVCNGAVIGLSDQYQQINRCLDDVAKANFKATHQAAQKYRDMPR